MTGVPAMRFWRTAASSDGACQRSSAATYQPTGWGSVPRLDGAPGRHEPARSGPGRPWSRRPRRVRGASDVVGMSTPSGLPHVDAARPPGARPAQASSTVVAVELAVLVPVKAFHAAKGRLVGTLDSAPPRPVRALDGDRRARRRRPLPTFVACDDDEVAEWAERTARRVWGPGLGLNGAVDDGVDDRRQGLRPRRRRPRRPAAAARPGRGRPAGHVTLVPDRRRDGTNVMSFPAAAPIRRRYGGGSFRRHLAQATAWRPPGSPSRCAPTPTCRSTSTRRPTWPTHPSARYCRTWLRTNPASRRPRRPAR